VFSSGWLVGWKESEEFTYRMKIDGDGCTWPSVHIISDVKMHEYVRVGQISVTDA
jgi:hypothetical protein